MSDVDPPLETKTEMKRTTSDGPRVVETVMDHPYSTESGCGSHVPKRGFTYVPDVVVIWNTATRFHPPLVTITCNHIRLEQVQSHMNDLMQRYAVSVREMAEFQLRMQTEYDQVWEKIEALDKWLDTWDESLPDVELGYMESDIQDLKNTADRIERDLKLALDQMAPLARAAASAVNMMETARVFHQLLATEFAGLVIGISHVSAQWDIALNKVKFHIGRLNDTLYTSDEMEKIQTLSGYKLPTGWRASVVKVRRAAVNFFRGIWNRIKSVAQTIKEWVSARNTAGLVLSFIVLSSLSAALGASGLIGTIVVQLKTLAGLKTLAEKVKWLGKIVGWFCQYMVNDDYRTAVVIWFLRRYAVELFMKIVGLPLFDRIFKNATAIAVGGLATLSIINPWLGGTLSGIGAGMKWLTPYIQQLYNNIQDRYPSWEKARIEGRVMGFVIFQVGMIYLVQTIRSFAGSFALRAACTGVEIAIDGAQTGAAMFGVFGSVAHAVTKATKTVTGKIASWTTWLDSELAKAVSDTAPDVIPTMSWNPFSFISNIIAQEAVGKMMEIISSLWNNIGKVFEKMLGKQVQKWAKFMCMLLDKAGIRMLGKDTWTDVFVVEQEQKLIQVNQTFEFLKGETAQAEERIQQIPLLIAVEKSDRSKVKPSRLKREERVYDAKIDKLNKEMTHLSGQVVEKTKTMNQLENEGIHLKQVIAARTEEILQNDMEWDYLTISILPSWDSIMSYSHVWIGLGCFLGIVGSVVFRTVEVRDNEKRLTPVGHVSTFPTVWRFEAEWDKTQPKETRPYSSGRSLIVARQGVQHLNKKDRGSGGWIPFDGDTGVSSSSSSSSSRGNLTSDGGQGSGRWMTDEEWAQHKEDLVKRYDELLLEYETYRILDPLDWESHKTKILEELREWDASEDGWNATDVQSKRERMTRSLRESSTPVSSSTSTIGKSSSSSSPTTSTGRRSSSPSTGKGGMKKKKEKKGAGDVSIKEAKMRLKRIIAKTRRVVAQARISTKAAIKAARSASAATSTHKRRKSSSVSSRRSESAPSSSRRKVPNRPSSPTRSSSSSSDTKRIASREPSGVVSRRSSSGSKRSGRKSSTSKPTRASSSSSRSERKSASSTTPKDYYNLPNVFDVKDLTVGRESQESIK